MKPYSSVYSPPLKLHTYSGSHIHC